jgi:nitrate reductase gamma subunit
MILYLITYACLAVFAIAVISRAARIARTPVHVRWELYPVAHDSKRSSYGGSYLEESDWWKKRPHKSYWGELKVMVPEIVLLKGLWEHNRPLWWRSFPFHFGLYMMVCFTVLLLIGAIGQLTGAAVGPGAASGFWQLVHYLTAWIGGVGAVLVIIGAIGLLIKRLTDDDLKDFTAPADLFNLIFIGATTAVFFVNFVGADRSLTVSRDYVAGLLSFHTPLQLQLRFMVEIVLVSLLIAYVPLTHMSHFFTKYFTYHRVRWDDEPNLPGGKFEAKIQTALQYPVSWAAPHIRGDGKKTWADVATEEIGKDEETKED